MLGHHEPVECVPIAEEIHVLIKGRLQRVSGGLGNFHAENVSVSVLSAVQLESPGFHFLHLFPTSFCTMAADEAHLRESDASILLAFVSCVTAPGTQLPKKVKHKIGKTLVVPSHFNGDNIAREVFKRPGLAFFILDVENIPPWNFGKVQVHNSDRFDKRQ